MDVGRDEPAGLSGLRAGDLVLTANGAAVASVDDLIRTMVLGDGAELTLRVARGEERLTLHVTPRSERKAA